MLIVPPDSVMTALHEHWRLPERLAMEALAPGVTAQTWVVRVDGERFAAKLCFDTQQSFESGLAASEQVDRITGLPTGKPVRTHGGDLSVLIPSVPCAHHPLALLEFVAGERAELDGREAARVLAKAHEGLRTLPPRFGHDPFDYLTDASVDYAHRDVIHAGLTDLVAEIRALDLTWGTCYGDGPQAIRLAGGGVGLIDWGGVLTGPVLWDVAEWTSGRSPTFGEIFQAELIDLGFAAAREFEFLPLVARVRSARELRFRAYRVLHAEDYPETSERDAARLRELAAELGLDLRNDHGT